MPSPYGRHRPRTSRPAPSGRLGELADEPGLADAGVADDGDQLGSPRSIAVASAAASRPISSARGRRTASAALVGDAVTESHEAGRRARAPPCP